MGHRSELARAVTAVGITLGVGLGPACNEKTATVSQSSHADCDKVAEILTNFELGPGAKPEARTPFVAKHRQTCLDTDLNAVEATCMAKATSTWELIECAPRMFPERSSGADCKRVAARVHDELRDQHIGSADAATLDAMTPVMETACLEDNWPPAYRTCVLGAKPDDHVAFKACELPDELQVKLGERLKPIVKAP